MTEIADRIDIGSGAIFYDGACGICAAGATRFSGALNRRGFVIMPLQSSAAQRLSGASTEQLLTQMHLLTPHHRLLRGIDALFFIARSLPWAWPLTWIAFIPGGKWLLDRLYRCFARNRYRI